MTIKTTDPQDELLTQVDENNNVIGPIKRKIAHETPGIVYRTVYILIKNSKGEYLFQKRSPTKDLYPDCWDLSVGGHVDWGNSYIETAVREIKEELGLTIKVPNLVFKGEVLVKLPKSSEFFYVYEYKLKPGQKINASKEEVADVKWLKMEEAKVSLKWYPRPEQVLKALY
jgi:isopentenyldiphosphate isomerase